MLAKWALMGVLIFSAAEDEQPMRDLTEDMATESETMEAATTPPVVLPEGNGNDCIPERSISNFEILDRQNLIVFAPSRRSPYWMKITGFCRSLRFSDAIGFESRDSRICAFGGDAIISGDDRCQILSIHRLDEASYAALREQFAIKRASRKKSE